MKPLGDFILLAIHSECLLNIFVCTVNTKSFDFRVRVVHVYENNIIINCKSKQNTFSNNISLFFFCRYGKVLQFSFLQSFLIQR
jgi:hypothetical protein